MAMRLLSGMTGLEIRQAMNVVIYLVLRCRWRHKCGQQMAGITTQQCQDVDRLTYAGRMPRLQEPASGRSRRHAG